MYSLSSQCKGGQTLGSADVVCGFLFTFAYKKTREITEIRKKRIGKTAKVEMTKEIKKKRNRQKLQVEKTKERKRKKE